MWDLGVSILVDSGDLADLERWLADPRIAGATTNPALLRSARRTPREFLGLIAPHLRGRPISLYPVAGSHDAVLRQAGQLRGIYPAVFIKVPVLDRRGTPNHELLEKISADGHQVNVTAVHDAGQATLAEEATRSAPRRVLSVLAGRLADSGRDPVAEVSRICRAVAGRDCDVLWASSRQVFDVVSARRSGCALITLPAAVLDRPRLWDADPRDLTMLAVGQFEDAARGAG